MLTLTEISKLLLIAHTNSPSKFPEPTEGDPRAYLWQQLFADDLPDYETAKTALIAVLRGKVKVYGELEPRHILEAHEVLGERAKAAARPHRDLAHHILKGSTGRGITAPDGVTTEQQREFMAAAWDAVEHALTQGATHEQARAHGDAQGLKAIGFTEPPALEAAPAEIDRIKAYVRSLVTPQG